MNQEDIKQHTKWLFSTIIERYKGEIVGGDIMNTHTIMEDLYDIDTVSSIDIQNMDGLDYLSKLPDNSVDLVLTDPPYIISRDSGMDKYTDHVKQIEKEGKNVKTEKEILLEDGSSYIPDRFIYNKDSVVVIDYKTGKRREKDKSQIIEYSHILSKLGYKDVERVLIYTSQKNKVVKV